MILIWRFGKFFENRQIKITAKTLLLSSRSGIMQVFQEGKQGLRCQEATGATCTQGNSSLGVHTLFNMTTNNS